MSVSFSVLFFDTGVAILEKHGTVDSEYCIVEDSKYFSVICVDEATFWKDVNDVASSLKVSEQSLEALTVFRAPLANAKFLPTLPLMMLQSNGDSTFSLFVVSMSATVLCRILLEFSNALIRISFGFTVDFSDFLDCFEAEFLQVEISVLDDVQRDFSNMSKRIGLALVGVLAGV